VGSSSPEVCEYLLELQEYVESIGATITQMRWLPRRLLEEEDGLSREQEVRSNDLTIDNSWMSRLRREVHQRWGCGGPNVDAFAGQGNKVEGCDGYATMSQEEGAIYDGVSFEWGRHRILWAFPPMRLAKRAISNWPRGRERGEHSFWCLPAVHHSPWRELMVATGARQIAGNVPVHGLGKEVARKWKFNVYLLRKA